MATISLNIPNAEIARAVDALATRWGYSPFLADGVTPNPQTKTEFVRMEIARWVKSEVRAHELATAQAAVTVTDVTIT